ncbi:predicted protein [Histoplasma capsulatum H143]|uniref:Uncharacterized protein n=1 Tax=Ajellomyces capsulatus (strain H143) TaxID=544712 RepID=C6H5F2_AJECH|nr:predicted protein [Histoplasma capsulatum H143]
MRIENKQFLVTNASQSRPPDSLLDPRPLYFLHPFEWRATVNNRALAQGTEPHLPDGILRRKISRSDDTTTAVSLWRSSSSCWETSDSISPLTTEKTGLRRWLRECSLTKTPRSTGHHARENTTGNNAT